MTVMDWPASRLADLYVMSEGERGRELEKVGGVYMIVRPLASVQEERVSSSQRGNRGLSVNKTIELQ